MGGRAPVQAWMGDRTVTQLFRPPPAGSNPSPAPGSTVMILAASGPGVVGMMLGRTPQVYDPPVLVTQWPASPSPMGGIMYVFDSSTSGLPGWVRKEVDFDRTLSNGDRGAAVKRLQEWLTLHGFGLSVDSAFGPVTRRAVERFEEAQGMRASGEMTRRVFDALVQPMRSALQRSVTSGDLGATMVSYAETHLARHPREIGGQNRGPWVRLYMKGHEGTEWAWCAGFVSFVMRQAADSLGLSVPIKGSASCDTLAAQAKAEGRFLAEKDVVPGQVPPGSVFLVRRTATDWTHTGLVTASHDDVIDTIEGNTNDDGSREGYEVCSRARGYTKKDFILMD